MTEKARISHLQKKCFSDQLKELESQVMPYQEVYVDMMNLALSARTLQDAEMFLRLISRKGSLIAPEASNRANFEDYAFYFAGSLENNTKLDWPEFDASKSNSVGLLMAAYYDSLCWE